MALAQCASATVCAGSKGTLPPLPWPFYLIGTRDSFTYQLVMHSSKVRPASAVHGDSEGRQSQAWRPPHTWLPADVHNLCLGRHVQP